jgi:hypothetical protein
VIQQISLYDPEARSRHRLITGNRRKVSLLRICHLPRLKEKNQAILEYFRPFSRLGYVI